MLEMVKTKKITLEVPEWLDELFVKELINLIIRYEKRKRIKNMEEIKKFRGIFGKVPYKKLMKLEGEL